MRAILPVLLAALLLPTGDAAARADSVEEAKATAPSLRLEKKTPETFELENGIRVWYLRNERLPLVNVRVLVRAGAIWEPSERQGVAGLTGRMLRVGGTAAWSPAEVDEELDFLAARVSTSIGRDQGSASLNVLTENLESALAIFSGILRDPSFDADRLGVEKNLQKEEIRRQNEDPFRVAMREYRKLVWGANHPRARTATIESVDALAREDLVDFHRRFFQPSNLIIGVTGDVSQKEIRKLLNAAFGNWDGTAVEFPEIPETPAIEAHVALARKDVPQTTVMIGHLGPREEDPHRAAGEVMMHILGSGGFNSYILDRVRVDEGLAYWAGGFLWFGEMDRGMAVTFALSKAETSCQAADLIREQIDRIRDAEVPDEDIELARNSILNSQAFEWDSPDEVVTRFMNLVYYGLPEDHDDRIIEEIGKLTKADVREAANAILDPSRFTVLAVGDPEAMDCEWSRFAEELGVELESIELE